MIVSCEKCTKKFSIQDDLIPKQGRLLQCGSCNHKWFYKSSIQIKNLENETISTQTSNETFADQKKKIIEEIYETSIPIKKKETKKDIKKIINKPIKNPTKDSNLIKKSMVLIISIIALIILIDTFKFQLEKYFPSVNLVLNNLYESLKDLLLFAKDLIN